MKAKALRQPTPSNGEPFYCMTCGYGYAEYLACEDSDCKLETREEARQRIEIMRGRAP